MMQYVLKRILFALIVVVGVSIIVFSLVRFIPGDVAFMLLGEQVSSPEQAAKIRHTLGLDKAVYEQYFVWVFNALQGDLGKSFWTGKPVMDEIMVRIPVTLELAVLSMAVSLLIAIPAGIISAARQDKPVDYVVRLLSILGLAVPGFWIGTMLIVFPAIWFRWVPPVGYVSLLADPSRNLQQFFLPALAMGAYLAGSVMRMSRSSLLEVLRQDYIRTAWAKGLKERSVVLRHALKNAMIPVITVMGVQFGTLLGGTVIMEQIFSLPGVGRLTLDAIFHRDYPQLQGNILFIATVFIVINLVVDITYAWLDPRIHYQ